MGSEVVLALLRITYPDAAEQVVPVTRSPFNIGRTTGNDLQLSHQLVSRNHARLLIQRGEIVLLDLNSSNGTRIGEKRLAPSEPYALAYGDAVTIGPYVLRLEAAPPPAESAPERGEEAPAGPDVVPSLARERPLAPRRRAAAPPPPPPSAVAPASPESGGPSYDDALGLPPDQSRYLQHLPPIYHTDPFMGRFLLGLEGILAPIEQIVDSFDLYLDPQTAPAYFLDQLAGWLGLTLDEKWPLEKRRAVLGEAAELYRRRGTRWALARHLEIYLGVAPEIVEPEDQPHHFKVVLRLPTRMAVDRATLERIIDANKPAHATYALEIVQAR